MAWVLSYTLYQEIGWVIDSRAIIGHLRLPRCWSEGLTMIQILKQHDLRTTVGGSIMVRCRPILQEAHGFRFTRRMIDQILWIALAIEGQVVSIVHVYTLSTTPHCGKAWRQEFKKKCMYIYTAQQQLNYGKLISRSVFSFWTNVKKCVKLHCRITSCESSLHCMPECIAVYRCYFFSFRWDHPVAKSDFSMESGFL